MPAREPLLELVRTGLRSGLHEEIDVQLEVPRADRHLDAVAVAACRGERLGDLRLRRAVEPHDPAPRRPRACEQPPHRLRLEHPRPEGLQLPWRPRERDRNRPDRIEDERRRRADETDDDRAFRDRRLLAHAVLEVGVGTIQARGDAAGDLFDLSRELLVGAHADARGACEELDGAVVVRRPQPTRDDEQLAVEPIAQRALEIGGVVADDGDARRLDAEPKE